MSTLELINTALKFHEKHNTLKFWPFEPCAQGSSCHIKAMN